MAVYYILIIIVLICFVQYCRELHTYQEVCAQRRCFSIRYRQLAVIMAALAIITVNGFRDYSVGADTSRYMLVFTEQIYGTGSQIFKVRADWLFTIFSNICSKVMSPRFFLVFIAVILVSSIVKFSLVYTDNAVFNLFLYITLGLFSLNMTGIRQSLAICMVLYAYQLAKKKRKILFLCVVLLASIMHLSAIACIIVYPAAGVRSIKSDRALLILCLVPLSCFGGVEVISKIVYLLRLEKYYDFLQQSGINYKSFILFFGIVFLATVFVITENGEISEKNASLFLLGIVCAMCYGVAPRVYLFDRMGLYFVTFLLAYLTNVLVNLQNWRTRRLAILATVGISTLWFGVSTPGGSLYIDHYIWGW